MYQAILFHPQGDNVTDFRDRATKDEVSAALNNMGSRWVFYPLSFVATDTTIVGTCWGLEWMTGKRIKTVRRYFQREWEERKDEIVRLMNMDAPLSHIYPAPEV